MYAARALPPGHELLRVEVSVIVSNVQLGYDWLAMVPSACSAQRTEHAHDAEHARGHRRPAKPHTGAEREPGVPMIAGQTELLPRLQAGSVGPVDAIRRRHWTGLRQETLAARRRRVAQAAIEQRLLETIAWPGTLLADDLRRIVPAERFARYGIDSRTTAGRVKLCVSRRSTCSMMRSWRTS